MLKFLFLLLWAVPAFSRPFTCAAFVKHVTFEEVHERFKSSLEDLKRTLKGVPSNLTSLREALLKTDARGKLFKLQGLLRLYEGRDVEGAEKALKKVKELEDALGAYDAAREFVKFSEEMEAPAKALEDGRSRLEAFQNHLNEMLQDWFLSEDPYFENFVSKVGELEAPKDRKLIKEFRKEVESFRDKDLDLNELQEGIHEFRRNVRWIPIYSEGLGDLFFLQKDKRIKKKYRGVNVSGKRDDSLVVPESLIFDTSNFISDIGKVKDAAEPIEFLAQSYVNTGMAKNMHDAEKMVHELMRKKGRKIPNTIPDAKKLVADFNRRQVYQRWIDLLKEGE